MSMLKNNLLSALLIVAVIAAGVFYFQNYKTQQAYKALKENPTLGVQTEIKDLVAKVGTLIALPENEQPTIATVTDNKKLKDQAFFAKSENGDKVLIYTGAKKAILYRSSTNKIIDVAPVSIGQQQKPPTLRVALYNGTVTAGATNTIEKELKEKANNVEIVTKDNAKKDDYVKTLVIDISGNQKDLAQQLANLLDANLAQLPEGEVKPNADILIIIGNK